MIFEPLFDAATSTWTYLIGDERTGDALLVDPVREQIPRDLARLKSHGFALKQIVETHIHADHVTAAAKLVEATGATPIAFATSAARHPALARVNDGDALRVGAITLTVMHTPGHTPESISLRLPDRVLTGDTLLVGTCARTDFQNGDPGALWDSIQLRLFTLPDETLIFPAHDYQGRVCTTIGTEKRSNERIAGRSREEFIALMNGLKLPKPKLMDVAVPANLRLGAE